MQRASPAILASKSVLVVDAPEDADVLIDALRSIGARVIGPVWKSDVVLEVLKASHDVDVAIIDVDILGSGLIGLVRAVRARGIPVLLASQGGCAAAEAVCSTQAASGKPVDLGMVASALWLGVTGPCE